MRIVLSLHFLSLEFSLLRTVRMNIRKAARLGCLISMINGPLHLDRLNFHNTGIGNLSFGSAEVEGCMQFWELE